MALDVPTLMLVGAFVALLSGALLILAWSQYREMSSVLWWAAAQLVLSCAIAGLVFGSVLEAPLFYAAGFLGLTLSPMLIWTSARLSDGRRPIFWFMALGPVLVIAANFAPAPLPVTAVRGGLSTLFNAIYLIAAAWTFARSRPRLTAHWPLVGLLLLHASVLLLGPVAAIQNPAITLAPVLSLFGMIHFEALIFMVGSTIFVVAGMREASELRHKQAAAIDPLTGLKNRRAFFTEMERVSEQCRKTAKPLSVILIDLDRFKAINDTHGHATGDTVLQMFADVARRSLRPSDILGRIGGEEFAVALPGTDRQAAAAIAERMRRSFETEALYVAGTRLDGTLCAGVAAGEGTSVVPTALLQEADDALYQAKRNGRNRVATADRLTPPAPGRLVRVA